MSSGFFEYHARLLLDTFPERERRLILPPESEKKRNGLHSLVACPSEIYELHFETGVGACLFSLWYVRGNININIFKLYVQFHSANELAISFP